MAEAVSFVVTGRRSRTSPEPVAVSQFSAQIGGADDAGLLPFGMTASVRYPSNGGHYGSGADVRGWRQVDADNQETIIAL